MDGNESVSIKAEPDTNNKDTSNEIDYKERKIDNLYHIKNLKSSVNSIKVRLYQKSIQKHLTRYMVI